MKANICLKERLANGKENQLTIVRLDFTGAVRFIVTNNALIKRNDNLDWLFSAIYASPNPRKRDMGNVE